MTDRTQLIAIMAAAMCDDPTPSPTFTHLATVALDAIDPPTSPEPIVDFTTWWSELAPLLVALGHDPGHRSNWVGFYYHGYTPHATAEEYHAFPTD